MMRSNNQQPFSILAISLVFISLSYFLIGERQIGNFKIKKINLVSDLTNSLPKTNKVNIKLNIPSKSIATVEEDSILLNNKDVIKNKILFVSESDTSNFLSHFFESIKAVKQGNKVRVAYFGDSMIEGDLLTQDLRYLMQKQFGGKGVGFVPITSPVAGFRRTIANNASEDWKVYNLVNADTSYLHRPGISGYSFIPTLSPVQVDTLFASSNSSWAKFSATKSYPNLKEFYNVSLYYGKSNQSGTKLSYTFGGSKVVNNLTGRDAVNELVINKMSPKQYLTLNMACSAPMPLYGLNFDSDTGVFIDNFAFRGNSGLALTKIPYKVLKDFNKYLHYDLIVLQYGLNVANASMTNYGWYEAGMIRVINYLKSCFPQASFLVVSVGDKSMNNHGVFETDPSIPILVEAQKRVAQKTGSAFWNLFEAMGGKNSMVNWVEGDTVLANKDYTHLNHRGASRVAKLLYSHLMDEYNVYNATSVKKIVQASNPSTNKERSPAL
jgi:hypothetical protein